MHTKILGFLLIVLIAAFAGCSGDGPTTPDPPDPGPITPLTGDTVGVVGGTITVSGIGSGLDGVELNVPEAAFDTDHQINIEYYDNSVILPPNADGVQASKVIRLTSETLDQAMLPLTLTIPYDQSVVVSPELMFGVFVDIENSRLTALGTEGINETAGTITVRTCHLGDYAVFYYNVPIHQVQAEMQGERVGAATVGCNFEPNQDGWFMPNFGSYNSPGGNCMGMAVFANWYHWSREKGRINDVGLYQKWRQGNQNDPMDDVIAHEAGIRAFIAVEQIWAKISYIAQDWLGILNDLPTGYQIYATLAVLQSPQVMILGNGATVAHAVSVYKYEAGNFLIYDSNAPGTVVHYPFSWTTGFGTYPVGSYDNCCIDSCETYIQNRDMKNIFNAAQGGFASSDFPTINCTSHTLNEEVDTATITLEGNVTGGNHPEAVLRMRIFVNGTSFDTPLTNNAFSQEVPLKDGDNVIWFYAYKNYTPQVHIYYASFKEMMIKSEVSGADILVTMTWNQNDTDLDLYVTEPGGETVWYSHMTSASGGQLDIDDTSGYGPEHYTVNVSEGDTLLEGNYVIRCHYYSDHDTDQAITYKFIVYYNGLSTIHTGAIATSDPSNNSPGSSGGDWRDIKTITVAGS